MTSPFLVRTDYTHQNAWEHLRAAVFRPSDPEGFLANIDVVDDESYRDLSSADLLGLFPDAFMMIFVADHTAISTPDHPLLVVPVPRDTDDDEFPAPPRSEFRVAVDHLWGVENNLSLSNMDWHEFAENVADDGVFRGFG